MLHEYENEHENEYESEHENDYENEHEFEKQLNEMTDGNPPHQHEETQVRVNPRTNSNTAALSPYSLV